MRAASLAVAGLLVLVAPAAEAGSRRVALVVGNNDGGAGRVTLRYAERDAQRMAGLLRELAGVERTVLLLGSTDEEVRRAIRRLDEESRGRGDVLFFYYSGHADNDALLLGRTRLPFTELRASLSRASSGVTLAFIDACQSGELTRTKGGRVVPVRGVYFDDDQVKGRVFITSSAAGESSQESDEIGASFFTHYLLSGLRGAADQSGDGRVSLEEAYRYAYQHTVASTTTTLSGPQHPSYRMDTSGTGELTLTWIPNRTGCLVVPAPAAGRYFVQHAGADSLVAEVTKPAGRALRIALAPGRYRVRRRDATRVMAQTVELAAAHDTILDESLLREEPLLVAARKGGEVTARHKIALDYVLGSGYLEQAGLMHGVQARYGRRLGRFWLGAGASYARSDYVRADAIAVELDEVSLLASLEWSPVRWRYLIPVAALEAGMSWVWQSGARAGAAPERRSRPVSRYRARLGVEVPIGRGLHAGCFGHLGQVVLEKANGLAAPLSAGLEAGLIVEL